MPASAPEPHLFVIFGGTGDLARRKLLPALYDLARQDLLGERWHVLGVARDTDLDDAGYRAFARNALERAGRGGDDLPGWCDRCLSYRPIGKGDDARFAALAARIAEIEAANDLPGHRTFYLALPPGAFEPTIAALGRAGLADGPGETRLVIEKPIGRDLESARRLSAAVHEHFREEQVYRIDHYLGKETVQNLLVFRFGNTLFEDLWNRDRIESVQITVAESIGVEDRGSFYDRTGAMRDIVQNHLVQLLALTAMEVPGAFDATSVRHEKVKVLRAIRPVAADRIVRAQYDGYRGIDGVGPDSRTETYFAAQLEVDAWRWQGVPFYVRTGKRLPKKLTEIAVAFRRPPVCLFESMGSCRLNRNLLTITLQPDAGFTLSIDVKEPGEGLAIRRIPLDFRYAEEFGDLPDAYTTLLLDVLQGDQTLFVHADEVEASWRLFDPLLESDDEPHIYPQGSWGPEAAETLLARGGHRWISR